jgi:hypothetical protein
MASARNPWRHAEPACQVPSEGQRLDKLEHLHLDNVNDKLGARVRVDVFLLSY